MTQSELIKKTNRQRGQTLIETLVAAVILTMGISAALALATYSLRATTDIKQRIIALGLAREGVEAVKNMRDTNWLRDALSQDCYNFETSGRDTNCYRNWLHPAPANGGYNIDPGGQPQTYTLAFDSTAPNPWQLVQTSKNFGLNFAEDDPTKGFYRVDGGVSVSAGTSGFGRVITITPDSSFSPFNQDTGPRIKVTSNVWWSGKNCPVSNTIPSSNNCKITLETYLTNWKTF